MKIIADSTRLLRVCGAAAKNISNKVALPILENFLIEVAPIGGIYITAANTDDVSRYLMEDVHVEGIEGDGRFCISSNQLLSILKVLPQQPVEITVSGSTATIRWGGGQGSANIPVYDADEYPEAVVPQEQSATIPLENLRYAMSNVAFAAVENELRPVMGGMLMDFACNRLVCVASDGHRLVKAVVPDVATAVEHAEFVLPCRSKNVINAFTDEVRRADTEAVVTITWNERKAALSANGHTVMMALPAEGRYPNYNSVIPQAGTMSADVDRDAFMGAIRRTMVFADPNTALLKLHFTPATLHVSAENVDYSISSSEQLPVQMQGAESLTIGVKGSYLLEILGHFASENIHIEGTDASRALVFRGVDDEIDMLMLQMPMMLND